MQYDQPKDISERIREISGQDLSIRDALDEWQKEHAAMLRLYDEKIAYAILNRRLLLALALAERAITAAETDAGMFITARTRETFTKFRMQNGKIVKAHSQELNEGE